MFDTLTHRRSARHLLASAVRRHEEQERKASARVTEHFNDGAMLLVRESRPRSSWSALHADGPVRHGDTVHKIRMGPNEVHAFITRPDGGIEDLGVSLNLLTNIGRDWWADDFGQASSPGGQGSPATATSATSATATGTPWTASNLATPQLGLAGKQIVFPITGLTTTPVVGLIVSNTSSVATVDKWWTPDYAGTGTTPASTSAFIILAGRGSGPFFMALTTNASAASASDIALASEITNNGAARAKATYAHTYGTATATHQVAYSISGTLTSIAKMGLFPTSGAADASPLIFETLLNQLATVGSGDTLTCTDTITYSG